MAASPFLPLTKADVDLVTSRKTILQRAILVAGGNGSARRTRFKEMLAGSTAER